MDKRNKNCESPPITVNKGLYPMQTQAQANNGLEQLSPPMSTTSAHPPVLSPQMNSDSIKDSVIINVQPGAESEDKTQNPSAMPQSSRWSNLVNPDSALLLEVNDLVYEPFVMDEVTQF